MVPQQIITRVFAISSTQIGSAFAVHVDGRQYLVTAKHIVVGTSGQFDIQIFHDRTWKAMPAQLVGHSPVADISVLALAHEICTGNPVVGLSNTAIMYGQDTYFLGFPLGNYGDHAGVMNGYPIPYVKKGVVSMISSPTYPVLVLDGINNQGFSGGPVAYFDVNAQDWKIAGAVSSYVYTNEPIYHANAETPFKQRVNAGLIEVAPIDYALELIAANPIGVQVI